MGCPPSGARSGGHPTSTTRPSLNDEITSHFLQLATHPVVNVVCTPKQVEDQPQDQKGKAGKDDIILENTLWIRVIMK